MQLADIAVSETVSCEFDSHLPYHLVLRGANASVITSVKCQYHTHPLSLPNFLLRGLFGPLIPNGAGDLGDHAFTGLQIRRRVRNKHRNCQMIAVRQGDDADVVGRGRYAFT